MTNATEFTLVPDLSGELLALMQARALTDSDGEYAALTALVHDTLLRMGQTVTDETEPVMVTPMWVQIIRAVGSDIELDRFDQPFKFGTEDDVPVLCVRPSHVIDHLRRADHLKVFRDTIPPQYRSHRALKRDMVKAGVVVMNGPAPLEHERTIKGRRVSHMLALSLPVLATYGVQIRP